MSTNICGLPVYMLDLFDTWRWGKITTKELPPLT